MGDRNVYSGLLGAGLRSTDSKVQMTQQEYDNIKKIESVWRYLGDQMIKAYGTSDFNWYADAVDLYTPIMKGEL